MFFTTTKPKNETASIDLNETQYLVTDQSETEENTVIISYESLRQQIREQAYYRWQEAGCPSGRDKEFWIEAEKELFGENALEDGGYKVKYNNSYVLITPINSEIPVKLNAEALG